MLSREKTHPDSPGELQRRVVERLDEMLVKVSMRRGVLWPRPRVPQLVYQLQGRGRVGERLLVRVDEVSGPQDEVQHYDLAWRFETRCADEWKASAHHNTVSDGHDWITMPYRWTTREDSPDMVPVGPGWEEGAFAEFADSVRSWLSLHGPNPEDSEAGEVPGEIGRVYTTYDGRSQ
ncbi:hypothetical protein [Nesterenkonia rhizosphaerae]|uniref:Polyketide cyclase n=1 Tax=Nesterenkonia rhizosphaerae TaxID=1348272 RepID=A0ABP9G3V2_9MICC